MFTSLMLGTWSAATVVAVVAGLAGFFTVLRGESFAAHAIPNGAFAGAAGATVLGVNPVLGLAVFAAGGAGIIAALGRRARADVATALSLVLMLGTGALLLSWSADDAQRSYTLLFGEVYGISRAELIPVLGLGAVCVAVLAMLWRRLLLVTVLPEVAEVYRVRPARAGLVFLLVLALTATMTVPVTGALLVFSLMTGPAAAARLVTARPERAAALSVLFALVTAWASVAASYLTSWPLGFFVGTGGLACYLLGRCWLLSRGWMPGRERLLGRASAGAGHQVGSAV